MVSPETAWPGRVTCREDRIGNSRILKVVSNFGPIWGGAPQIQIAQILDDMRRANFSRPILWLYNAGFAEALAALPAVARVHHVTENYFDFPDMSQLYLDRVALATSLADLNVAVSEGCAKPLRSFTSDKKIMIATNGCDFSAYNESEGLDAEIVTLHQNFRRLGVFGGNINDRLDFDLMARAVKTNTETFFLFVGDARMSAEGRAKFSLLCRNPNVGAIGKVSPDRLPAIYRAADFGFIPYIRSRLIVENGFPLKALEMAATGLPVVSTFMKPLAPFSPPLAVAQSDSDFLSGISQARRHPEHEKALRAIAFENNYDIRFSEILEKMAHSEPHTGSRIDVLAATYPHAELKDIATMTRKALLKNAIFYGLRYRFFISATQFVDRLPSPLRKFVIAAKRALVGRSAATQ
ncbi:MAG: glycosyltransferase [Bacteroidota bacterium]|nr:glycosyltransferase [Bacteroidota bacterium]